MATGKTTWSRSYTDRKTGDMCEVTFEMDVEAVSQHLAARAILGRSGKAQALNGDIKAKVVTRVKGVNNGNG